MARNGDLAVFLVDAAKSMLEEAPAEGGAEGGAENGCENGEGENGGSGSASASASGSGSRLNIALSLVQSILAHKILMNPHDVATVVLFGTNSTNNFLHQETGKYANIKNIGDVSAITVDYCRELTREKLACKSATSKVPLAAAVDVASDLLTRAARELRKNGGRQIFVFTDGTGGVGEYQQTVDVLKTEDHTPVIIWLGSEEMNAAKKQFQEFAEAADGIFLEQQEAIENLRAFRVKKTKQVSKTRVPLVFNSLEIPVWVFLKIRAATLPTLKAEVTKTGSAVHHDRCYLALSAENETGEVVDAENRLKAFIYGKDLIPAADYEAKSMKYAGGPKSIRVLCSLRMSRVKPEAFLSSSECVVADPGVTSSKLALGDLVNSLLAEDMCLVVRYVWREPYDPKIMLLWAYPKRKCLYMNQLPFAEDFRPLLLPSLAPASQEKKELLTRFIEEMSLSPEHYRASATSNPRIQKFYELAQAKILDRPYVPNPALDRLVAPDEKLLHDVGESGVVQAMQAMFPLKPLEQRSGPKKRTWMQKLMDKEQVLKRGAVDVDALLNEAGGDDADQEEAAAKKRARSAKLSVNTTDPSSDFVAMLEFTETDLTERAVTEMGAAIRTLIFEGGLPYYVKAVRAVETFRKYAVQERYTKEFNRFMVELRPECRASAAPAWTRLRTEGLGLISRTDDPELGEEPAVCEGFFGEVKQNESEGKVQPKIEEQEEEDLLSLLE